MTLTDDNEQAPRAVDRKELSKDPPIYSGTYPRTDRRTARLRATLRHRQTDLTVVLENVHDLHNISAVMRTCDAVGIPKLHLIYSIEQPPSGRFARRVSAGTAKWVDAVNWPSIEGCYAELRSQGMRVLAASLSDGAVSIHNTDFSAPSAIVFGNEMRGLTQEAVDGADGEIAIPMMGMVQSLNISVSCAVTLYEALRQRAIAGAYDKPTMSKHDLNAILAEWLKR